MNIRNRFPWPENLPQIDDDPALTHAAREIRKAHTQADAIYLLKMTVALAMARMVEVIGENDALEAMDETAETRQ